MASRFSRILSLLFAAIIVIAGCKGSSTDPNNSNHTNFGDSIPRKGSTYSYLKSYLDLNNNIIPGTILPGFSALNDSIGIKVFGKENAYLILDEGDSGYYSYETNGDVSTYLLNPGYIWNFSYHFTDETLETIVNLVFHNWITLPIASKHTGLVFYNNKQTINIPGDNGVPADIRATVDYIADSSIVHNGDTLVSKQCRISITAKLTLGTDVLTLTHVRDLWFVPKIGYIVKVIARTNMPAYPVLVLPLDTTATLKTMTSYQLK